MRKTEIIKELAKKENISQDKARDIVDSFTEIITSGLKVDGLVQITGFGTFKAKKRAERVGHNPKNVNETITIPAKVQVSFSSGESLKKSLND